MSESNPILDTKYILLSKIGDGLTAEVYLTKNIKNNEISATKIMKSDEEEENKTDKNKAFKTETEILKQIKNDNIVNIIESGEGIIEESNGKKGEKYPYLTLEYAEKGDLFNYIYYPKKGLGENLGKIIFKEILNGIKACHDNKIVHRDLKLENILLDNNYNAKIADFGFAVIIKDNEKLKTVIGTQTYQAPEIYLKKPYDGIKIDIFSLGVILFILVVGQKPFELPFGKDKFYRNILKKQYSNYWNSLKTNGINVDDLSNEFKQLFIKMIQFNPNERINLNDVINSDFMKGNLDDNKSVIDELSQRENIVKKQLETQNKESTSISTSSSSSSSSKKLKMARKMQGPMNRIKQVNIKKYFDDDIKISFVNNQKGFSNIFIIHSLKNEPFEIFNCVIHSLENSSENIEKITPSQNLLKFNILYKEDFNNEDSMNLTEEDKEIEGMIVDIELEKLEIEVKFYKMTENNMITFKKIQGDIFEFHEKVTNLKSWISETINIKFDIEYV
jgi:serine/threonine protein kinase